MVVWSELPYDLLYLIGKKLDIVADRCRFRSVCKSWRCSLPPFAQPPWLMLSEPSQSEGSVNPASPSSPPPPRGFVGIGGGGGGGGEQQQVVHEIELPEAHQMKCVGSTVGVVMAGGDASSSRFKVNSRCYTCGELDHWKNDCYWKDYLCVKCKIHPMKLFTSNKEGTKGDRFFRCTTQPICNGFEWFDAAKKKKEEEEKIKGKEEEEEEEEKLEVEKTIAKNERKSSSLKLKFKSKVPMIAEGNAEDMAALIKELENLYAEDI